MPDPHYMPENPTPEDSYLARIAAGWVASLAPPPDPVTDEYEEDATAAEFAVFNWLKATKGGSLTAASRSGLSASFTDRKAISALVRPVMGENYVGWGFRTVDIERA